MMARAEWISGNYGVRTAPSDGDEKRAAPRHVTTSEVGLMHVGGNVDFCRVRNISATGLMAHVYRPMEAGEDVRFEMKCGRLLEGYVVWAADYVPDLASRVVHQIGVRFHHPIEVEPILPSKYLTGDGDLQRLPRISVDCHLRLRLGVNTYSGSLCDISQSGAKVQTAHAISGEKRGSLLLRGFPPLDGSIRWTKGSTVGIAFDEAIKLEPLVNWIRDRRADAAGNHVLHAEQPRPDSRA